MNEPDIDRLTALRITDRGFAFDPRSGESFTLNLTGRQVILSLVAGCDLEQIGRDLAARFLMDASTVHRDLRDFVEHLRVLRLVEGAR